jgi:hypothetical protein
MAEAPSQPAKAKPKPRIKRVDKPSVPYVQLPSGDVRPFATRALHVAVGVEQLNQHGKPIIPGGTITSVDDWARFRQRNIKYTFTPAGDLVGPDQTVVEMIPKVKARPDVIQQRLEERKAIIAEAEAKFTKARRDLFQVIAQHRADPIGTTSNDVILANQAVHDADCALALVAKYPRYIQRDGVYIFRDLHLNDFYNVRKFPDPVLEIEYTTFPVNLFWEDRYQEKITLDGLSDDYTAVNTVEEEAKKKAARTGAIIANAMAGRV